MVAGEAGKEAIIPLERNTGWIRMVAEQIVAELEKLAPAGSVSLVSLPAAASGALVPPSAAAPSAPLDLGSLADTIANAIASAGQSSQSDPVIRVYLDGKQLTDVVPRESLPCAPRESLCPSARYCGRYKGVGLVSSSYLLRGR